MFHYVSGFGVANATERLQSAFQDNSLSCLELEGFVFDDNSNAYLNQQLANKLLDAIVFRNCQNARIDYWAQVQALTLQGSQPFIDRIGIGGQLVELNLASISVSEDLAASLGRQMGTHNSLKRLDCSESRFLDDGPRFFAQGLAVNRTLESVNFADCNLMDESVAQLVDALRHNQPLVNLDISFNKCRSMGVAALANLVTHKQSLKELSMGFQAFGEGKRIGLQPLYFAISNSSSKLMRLEICGNSICDDDVPYLVHMLCNNSSVSSLDLSANRLSDAGIQVLSARLNDVKGLRHLALEENNLHSSSLEALARALKSNLSLADMELCEDLISSDNVNQDTWRKLAYYLDLNWGGRRLLKEHKSLPGSLWPVLLARASRPQEFNFAREVKQHDVSYFILQEIAHLLV
mmetsp:Transcript_27831/g.67715  ORF Transcript_27831/g.67715 Transcript_27831/m.67715 type:complete len:407 (-) Transcript_27831:946-2166(-)